MLPAHNPECANRESWIKSPKRTEGIFSSGEQKLLVEVCEEYKHIITTQKGNTVTINKKQGENKIADLLNACVVLSLTFKFNIDLRF